MKQAIQSRFIISLAAGITLGALGVALPGSAQLSSPQPLQDLQNPDKSGDPFSNRTSNPLGSVMDLIHRSVLGPSRNLDEYTAEQQENLDAAAAEFRAKQAERLHPGQVTPGSETPLAPNPALPGSSN